MEKSWAIAIALLSITAVFVMIYNYNTRGTLYSPEQEVCFRDECFSVEIADDMASRTVGLMHRESLEKNSGMLFIFDEPGQHGFWMKNTLIALDIIWISEDKKVVHIKDNAVPCTEEACESIIPSSDKALYVLEINSGLAEELGIKVGDEVIIK